VTFQTADVTTTSSTAAIGGDYTSRSYKVTLPANSTATKRVDIDVRSDTVFEVDETFQVQLSNPVNARLGTSVGTGTIVENDHRPRLSLDPSPSVMERNGTPVVMLASART
jgi:hypothetical protein